MGYLKDQTGFSILGGVPEGACEMCAVKHDPEMPHNRQSLTYQYKFYDEHGRWPSWRDAMAHCTPKVKKAWIIALISKGVDID